MKRNIGNTDRFVRIIFGIILLILVMSGSIENATFKWIVLGISTILIVTSFITYCPMYTLLGKNTCEVKKR